MSTGMSDQDIMKIMPKETPATQLEAGMANTITPATTRKLLIIGCGDGGCNIASEIGTKLGSEAYVIAYNTSTRAMESVNAAIKILPGGEDGAGKIREYSKDIFKRESYKRLLETVQNTVTKKGPFAYIVVCTTTDGGTGSGISPMTAKLLSDNIGIPVIILGVYPSMSEDATAQFNALQWQTEVGKTGIPYFVLDNDQPGMSKKDTHRTINQYAAVMMSLLAGKEFGNSNISMIDDRNLYMLLVHLGQNGRAVASVSTTRMQTGQSLDAYVDDMLQRCYQPVPKSVKGYGIYVKGPDDLLAKLDTSLRGIQAKYGNAQLNFSHIEVSDEFKVAVLLTGCAEASDRLTGMKNRYDDVMAARVNTTSVLGDLMEDMTNPMGAVPTKPMAAEEMDTSALDL